jgi:general secretion pathway protein L
VAVVDRAWLEFTTGAFERRGMRVRAAWPGQLAVPWAPDRWSMSCTHGGLALRFGENEGLGWTAGDDADFAVEAVVALLQTALAQRPAPAGLAVFVDGEGWREPVERAAARLGLAATVAPLALPEIAPIDLLGARAGAGRRWMASFEPRVWRWPAAMAAACLVAWLVGMNLHWAQLAREKDAIRRSLESAFRSAFPSAQVVVDPVLQMNRQVAALRARSGQAGPEDFVPLVARFAQALGPLGVDALAALEYRDGRLKVRFRPQRVDGRAAREQLQDACRRAGLRLTFDNDREPTATVGLQS